MAKGSQFERDTCRQLSEWWSGGEREDIFWRTATSGARATTRTRQGKGTFGQYGDIQATDPIGQPLLDLITFELKRGYPRVSPLDFFVSTETPWIKWLGQASNSAAGAGTPYWMVVWKRDRRDSLAIYPALLDSYLESEADAPDFQKIQFVEEGDSPYLSVMLFNDWLRWVGPADIESVRSHHV